MEFLQVFTTPEAWIALATLAMLEIVLGVDNIIFISVLVDRLPKHQQQKGRIIGLGLAMGTRIPVSYTPVSYTHLTLPTKA